MYGDGIYYIHEYIGFGCNYNLTPSKPVIIQHALQALRSLDTTIPLYLIGESLGTGIVCELANTQDIPTITALILITPYSTMAKMANVFFPLIGSFFLTDRYDCIYHLSELRKNGSGIAICVVIAKFDEVIPLKQSLSVANVSNATVLYFNGGHNEAYRCYREWISRVVSE